MIDGIITELTFANRFWKSIQTSHKIYLHLSKFKDNIYAIWILIIVKAN